MMLAAVPYWSYWSYFAIGQQKLGTTTLAYILLK